MTNRIRSANRKTNASGKKTKDALSMSRKIEALMSLRSAIRKLLVDLPDKPSLPPTLYHFTDVGGLVGIITRKMLWGSLATSLSDASETKYALSRLRDNLEKGSIQLRHQQRKILEEVFKQDDLAIGESLCLFVLR